MATIIQFPKQTPTAAAQPVETRVGDLALAGQLLRARIATRTQHGGGLTIRVAAVARPNGGIRLVQIGGKGR